jgi:serine/alanine adding enzyme
MMSIQIVRDLPRDEWQSFIDENPQSNFFHTPEFYEVMQRTKNHKPELWAVTDGGQILVLMLPVKIAVMRGVLGSLVSRRVVYGGLLNHPERDTRGAVGDLLRSYVSTVKSDAVFTEFRNQNDVQAYRDVLESCHFAYEEHCNYLVDLCQPVEKVWDNLHDSLRKKLGQARRKNTLIIEEMVHREQIPIWYELIHQTFSRAHVPLADISLFEAAFDILLPRSKVRFLLGRVGDDYVAASAILLHKKNIYDWYQGFNRDYRSYLPNDLLVWNALEWGAANGFTVFDFGGAGKPNEEYGPRSFKAKFGGRLMNYGRNVYVHSPLKLRISRLGYQGIRKFLIR